MSSYGAVSMHFAMPDQIIVRALELSAHIGVPDEERQTPQRLTVDLVMEPAEGFADLGDSIERTVDYFAVSKAVQVLARERPRKLIETVAEEIAGMLLSRFGLRAVEVELRKYILPDTDHVAVRIRREQGGGK